MKNTSNQKFKIGLDGIIFIFKFISILASFICLIYLIKYKYNFDGYYLRNFRDKKINLKLIEPVFISYLFLFFLTYISYIVSIFKIFHKKIIRKNHEIIFLTFNFVISIFYLALFFVIPFKRNKPLSELLIFLFLIEFAVSIILLGSVLNWNKNDKKRKVLDLKTLVEISVMSALCVLLSVLADLIIPKFPAIMGGSRPSLTMLPIILISFRKGIIPGLLTGFIYSIFNILIDGYIIHVGSIFLDYIIPFTLLGLAGIFKNQVGKGRSVFIYFGTVMVASIRYLSSSISGVLFFKDFAPSGVDPYVYSFIYVNAAPIFIGAYITVGILYALNKHFILEKSKII